MKIISIDTSGKFCSVSISLPNGFKESINSKSALSHSSDLAVNIKEIIYKNNLLIEDLDLIIINIGPGSFTGLRIGISFAKGLSLSSGIPLVPVNSFDIMNYKINCQEDSFCYGVYSHKDYMYCKKYNNNKGDKPQLVNLKDQINIPIYLAGLDSVNQYHNNIIKTTFDSLDLIEIGIEQSKDKKIQDLNLVKPMYIDYNNVI